MRLQLKYRWKGVRKSSWTAKVVRKMANIHQCFNELGNLTMYPSPVMYVLVTGSISNFEAMHVLYTNLIANLGLSPRYACSKDCIF